jgi:hypothetical protein
MDGGLYPTKPGLDNLWGIRAISTSGNFFFGEIFEIRKII